LRHEKTVEREEKMNKHANITWCIGGKFSTFRQGMTETEVEAVEAYTLENKSKDDSEDEVECFKIFLLKCPLNSTIFQSSSL
jgi:hypothetical protein